MNYTLSDLYRMYKKAVWSANNCVEERRGGRFGIACEKDKMARRWQKWDALATRLDIVIKDRLRAIDSQSQTTALSDAFSTAADEVLRPYDLREYYQERLQAMSERMEKTRANSPYNKAAR